MKKLTFLAFFLLASTALLAQTADKHDGAKRDGVTVRMTTTEGDIVLLLYNDTPRHRDNFMKLVKDGTYDGLLFHRVIKNFMIHLVLLKKLKIAL